MSSTIVRASNAPRARVLCSASTPSSSFMRFEQMPEVQDRRLVRDRIASEFEIAERAHRLDMVQRFLGARDQTDCYHCCRQ